MKKIVIGLSVMLLSGLVFAGCLHLDCNHTITRVAHVDAEAETEHHGLRPWCWYSQSCK